MAAIKLPARTLVEVDYGDLARMRDLGIDYSPLTVSQRARAVKFAYTRVYDVAVFGELTPDGLEAFLRTEADRVAREWLTAMRLRFPR